MRVGFLLVLFGVAVLGLGEVTSISNAQPVSTDHRAVVEQIKALENELARAVIARDYEALRRVEAENYVYTDSDAHVNTRNEFIEAYRSGKSRISLLRFDDMSVDIYGDTAIVRGILSVDRSDNGVHLYRRSRYTRVYIRFPEAWQAVVGHSSQLKQEASARSN